MKIYLAGPLGFSEVGREFYYGTLIPRIISLGHTPLDPWRLTNQSKINSVMTLPYGVAKRDTWRQLNKEIGENNQKAIDACDAVLAVLDGVDVDSGTAAEIGYAFARGKPIAGYRGDFRLSSDNEGSQINLQVEYFIERNGGKIVTQLKEIDQVLTGIANTLTTGAAPVNSSSHTHSRRAEGTPMNRQNAAVVVIGILIALILKAALESAFKPVFERSGSWSMISPCLGPSWSFFSY